MIINFYTKVDCLLCKEALVLLETLKDIYSFEINICDIHDNDKWLEKYFLLIPVIDINGTILIGDDIEFSRLEKAIQENLKK